jgi:hypothetical protein
MENRLSYYLSYILHPVVIPTLATVALWKMPEAGVFSLPLKMKLWFTLTVFFYSFALPASVIFLLSRFKIIDSMQLGNRKQRVLPLLIASISYFFMVYSLKTLPVPPALLMVLYLASLTLIAGLLINLFFKISLHTLGWGSFIASLAGINIRSGIDLLWLIIVTILMAGLAGYARLKQDAHSPTELYLGYLSGIFISVAVFVSL